MRFMNRRRREISPEETAANRAKKALRAKRCATCQICGRAILANTGFIANHGYTRPGQGWQTASCMGAQELPFEVSSDVLPPAIASVTAHIGRTEVTLADWLANPPAGIEVRPDKYGQMRGYPRSNLRPAGFDPNARRGCYSFDDKYAQAFDNTRANLIGNLKSSRETLAYFQDRLANWKPTLTLAQWEARTIEVNS